MILMDRIVVVPDVPLVVYLFFKFSFSYSFLGSKFPAG